MHSPPLRRSDTAFLRLVVAGIIGFAGLLLLAALSLTASGSLAVWLVGGVVVGGLLLAAGAQVVSRWGALGALTVVLALQVFQLSAKDGTQPGEVVAALAFLAYVGAWYARAAAGGFRELTSGFDVAALLYGTVGLLAGCALGYLFGFGAYDFRADILAALPFVLYLPVKDAVARYRHGALVVALVLVGFGLFTTVQALFMLRAIAAGAVEWWEVADVRFTSTETAITSGLLLCFAGYAGARTLKGRLALMVGVGVLLGGLILTKSRGYWVAGALGLGVAFLLSGGTEKRRLIIGASLGIAALSSIALLFFADQVELLAIGTLNRLFSLTTATTKDISLVNRFSETAAAWEMVVRNPIIGHGWGVPVTRFDIVHGGTVKWSFLHNGYVSLLFKTGVWGFLMMMAVWVGAIVRGTLIARTKRLTSTQRACAIGFVSSLVAFSVSAITSNPFAITDQMMIVTLLMAGCHGLADRARWAEPSEGTA